MSKADSIETQEAQQKGEEQTMQGAGQDPIPSRLEQNIHRVLGAGSSEASPGQACPHTCPLPPMAKHLYHNGICLISAVKLVI